MYEVQLKIDGNKGFFYIDVDGKHEAMMTFVFAGNDKIIIDQFINFEYKYFKNIFQINFKILNYFQIIDKMIFKELKY